VRLLNVVNSLATVFVIDRADRVVHAEYVADQMLKPDYDAAIEAICRGLAPHDPISLTA
jgi:hypothetical protein